MTNCFFILHKLEKLNIPSSKWNAVRRLKHLVAMGVHEITAKVEPPRSGIEETSEIIHLDVLSTTVSHHPVTRLERVQAEHVDGVLRHWKLFISDWCIVRRGVHVSSQVARNGAISSWTCAGSGRSSWCVHLLLFTTIIFFCGRGCPENIVQKSSQSVVVRRGPTRYRRTSARWWCGGHATRWRIITGTGATNHWWGRVTTRDALVHRGPTRGSSRGGIKCTLVLVVVHLLYLKIIIHYTLTGECS